MPTRRTILTGLALHEAAFTSKLRAFGLYAAILGFTSEYRHAARV
jgi:hypothetical protein